MDGNPWSGIGTGTGSSLSLIIKICEYTYALRAVDQQTQEYLITAQHASENISVCRRLLTLRQDLLPGTERKDFERVIHEARKAADEVARLLEPARVDVDAESRLRFSTRVLWVLRDDANIAAALRRLAIVHTTLTQNIATLRLMRVHDMEAGELPRAKEKPPSYESSQLLHWKRQTRLTSQLSTHQLQPEVCRVPSTATYPGAGVNSTPQPFNHELQPEVRRVTSTATYPGASNTPMWLDLKPLPDLPTEFASELARRHTISYAGESTTTAIAKDDDISADDVSAIREILQRDYGFGLASPSLCHEFKNSNAAQQPEDTGDSSPSRSGVFNHEAACNSLRRSTDSKRTKDWSISHGTTESSDAGESNELREAQVPTISLSPPVPEPVRMPGSWLEHQARRGSRLKESRSMLRYA